MIKINEKIFIKKYQQDNETYEMMCKRVAFNNEQYESMLNGHFMPAGRQLAARGFEEFKTLFNCYVLGFRNINGNGKDSKVAINDLEGRGDTISSKGGGIGVPFSVLRPSTAKISNLGKFAFSSGVVSFIKRFAHTQNAITQGGNRRGALIGLLEMWHPSIFEFIDAKLDLTELNNMNISVFISNKFMNAVENDLDWDLIFPDIDNTDKKIYNEFWNGDINEWINLGYKVKVYDTVKAVDLWNKIIENAWKTGEPGIIFGDNINDVNNYKDAVRINATNPCFSGDTLVQLTGAKTYMSIKELSDKYKIDGKQFSVVSDKFVDGKWISEIQSAIAFESGIKPLYKITLDDNSSFKCTPDHKLYLPNGNSIEAKDSLGYVLQKMYVDENTTGLVIKVEDLNVKEMVYDLTVNENHNFHIFTVTPDGNYMSSILVSNCGEKNLPITPNGEGSSCNLGSINLKSMFNEKYEDYIDWGLFQQSIELGVTYLDKVIDTEHYFSKGIEKNQKYFRDIGLGVMGYADLLILKKLKYGSEEALNFTEKLMSFMLDKSYYHSAVLAKELGKAPVFDDIELNKYYYNKCSDSTKKMIDKYGLRNGNVLSIAPTGSISMMLEVNGGLEPYFQFEYERDDVLGKRIVIPQIVQDLKDADLYEEYKPYLVTAEDVTPEQHIHTQAYFQNFLDSSCSKTVNLPSDATQEDVSNVYKLAHKLGIKGTTVYRDGCRAGVLNKVVDAKENEILEHELIRQFKDAGDNVIIDGINPPKISHLVRTKIKTNKGKKYYFMVGYVTTQFKKPFEFFIFTNHSEKTDITNRLIDDMIAFLSSKNIDEKLLLSMRDKMKKQNNVDRISRLISMALRHNVKIIEIANILEDYTESISSLIFWIRKHLLSLIEDGTVTNEVCPECGSPVIREGGCLSCIDSINCGWSKC